MIKCFVTFSTLLPDSVLCLLPPLCSLFKSLLKPCRLFPNISHLRLHLGSIYKLLHRVPLPSQFCSTSNPPVALLNYSRTPSSPPLFTPMKAMLFQHMDYQLTEWILLLSMRRCINVNHIRRKLIHLNSIETICVLKIALCTLANAERPVDVLWTTRTKCALLFFFSVARFCRNCNLFWKLLWKLTESGDNSLTTLDIHLTIKIQRLAAGVLIALSVSEKKILNHFGLCLMINPRSLYYKRQSVDAVWGTICIFSESYETHKGDFE